MLREKIYRLAKASFLRHIPGQVDGAMIKGDTGRRQIARVGALTACHLAGGSQRL